MAANTVSQIASADKGKELNFVEKNGEILFTAEEVGRHLGYSNPQESINRLRQEAIRRAAEQARLDTADLALSLSPEGRKQMLKALGYRKRGFTYREIAKLMDSHQRTVGNLLRTARKLGLEV